MLAAVAGTAQDTMPYTAAVTVRATLRETPAEKSKSAGILPKGTELQVHAEKGRTGWYYVTAGRLRGWIHDSMFVPLEISTVKSSDELPDIPESVGTRTTSPETRGWKVYATSVAGDHYYKPFGILWADNIARLWTMRLAPSGEETDNYLVIDCVRKEFMLLDSIDYDGAGKALGSTSFKSVARPSPIAPDSVVYTLSRELCRTRGVSFL